MIVIFVKQLKEKGKIEQKQTNEKRIKTKRTRRVKEKRKLYGQRNK